VRTSPSLPASTWWQTSNSSVAPTEKDHNQVRRKFDIYVRPQEEYLGAITKKIQAIVDNSNPTHGISIELTGSVTSMNAPFRSFAIGLTLFSCTPVPYSGRLVPLLRGPVHHSARSALWDHRGHRLYCFVMS
jgi:hypothetical protein